MASARTAWGIDIGNRALKAVKLVREGDLLRVDDFELIEHETVLSNSGDNRESFIQSALSNFVQRHQTKGAAIAVGVSGQQSFARFIKLPPVEEKKIPEIVRFEAIQQIPFPLDDVEWSYQLFRQAESPDVEVGIFAMRKELVNQHIKYFTDFDLNVQVVQMNPLAVYNAMNYDGRLEKGTTMIIDLGAENTDLIIADKESIWMRSIPIGGNNFTQTLEKAFKLPFTKAEDLKRNAATSKYARQIFQAMRPVFADLVAEIQRSVGFYASVHRDSRIRKIMALGGTFKLPGLQKYLQQNLQLDVERPDNVAAGAPSDPKLASTFQENLLSVVSAYGLAVQAMGEAKITSSLLPQRIRREKMWKEKTKWFAATAALFVLGTSIPLASYFVQNMQYEANEAERTQASTVQREASDLDSKWSEIESAGSTERSLIMNIRSMIDGRDVQRRLLTDVAAALPEPAKSVQDGMRAIGSNTDAGVRMIKQIPRDQRQLITINSIQMDYHADINSLLKGDLRALEGAGGPVPRGGMRDEFADEEEPERTPGAGAIEEPMEAEVEIPQRGFLVTVNCSSPFAMARDELIPKKLIPALLNIKPNAKEPNKPYAVKKAALQWAIQLNQDQARLDRLKQEWELEKRTRELGQRNAPGAAAQPPPRQPNEDRDQGGADGAADPAANGGPAGAPEPAHPAFLDRLLGEDIRNDWEISFAFIVVLDPAPYTPETAPTEGEPAAPQAAAQ